LNNTTANTATAIYTVTPTSGTCSGNSFTINVTVYANLTAGISGGTPNICYGSSPGTLTANGSGGSGLYTYQWYNSSALLTDKLIQLTPLLMLLQRRIIIVYYPAEPVKILQVTL